MSKSIDAMTGLPNADQFQADLTALLEQEEISGGLVICMTDMDRFQRVNDTYGREAGDQMILMMASLLQEYAPQGRSYRHGGDSFALIVEGMEKEEVFLRMEALRLEFLKRLPDPLRNDEQCTLSIGVASYPEDGSRLYELVNRADNAMYRAKWSGRNKVSLAREEKMVPKTSHYATDQLKRLNHLAKREGIGEAVLLREALGDLLKKYDV